MITLNNSNIDFDLKSSNSILLSDTSNLVFRTKTFDRMTVMDSGNVGIGVGLPSVPLEVAGNIKASGRIVSTGEGFEGKGTFITEIPIDGVATLRTTLTGLSGSTNTVILNVEDTSNKLVNRTLEEIRYGSNYTFRISSELNTRTDNTSNYIVSTSNLLINRVAMEVLHSSNYTFATSNLLVNRIVAEVGFGSNYLSRMDTNASNYIMSASNLLVNRIVAEVGFGSNFARDRVGVWGSNYTETSGRWGSNYADRLHAIAIVRSQWGTTANPVNLANPTIFYNDGNVGIGIANPLQNLHIYSSNNSKNASSKLVIQESNTSNVFSSNVSDILSAPYVVPTVISGTIDKYMVFTYTSDTTGTGQTQYDITLPENYSYDVLMVGGGGGGGGDFGGGGGGGAVMYGSNLIIPAGGYTLKVGNGGNGTGQNGYSTEGFNALCLGGGGAKNIAINSGNAIGNTGGSGGSGAGGKSSRAVSDIGSGGSVLSSSKGTILATSFLFGNNGGTGVLYSGVFQSGGGGGAGAVGNNGTTNDTITGGAGGAGIQLNITGVALFWGAGGGGGASAIRAGNGGIGGGGPGTGSQSGTVGGSAINIGVAQTGMNAVAGSGSGGGGGSGAFQSNGGNGGSGIIVIRYRPLISLNGTPEMQFVIGNTLESGSSNYKIGNYNGNFQIKTSTSNIDTTSFIIQSTANVGVGTSVAVSKLHLFDNSSNAILTIQDNTSIPTLTIPTNISPTAVSPATSITTLSTIGTYDKIISFAYSTDSLGLTGQTQYTFTASEDINVDILVVGGGGAGGCFGGGGGGGQVLLTTNYNIPMGTFVTVNVGKGGAGVETVATNGQNGFPSSIMFGGSSPFIANGGGGGGSRNTATVAGNNGGSGGGSSSGNAVPASLGGISTKNAIVYPSNWKSFGNNGGIGSYKPTPGSAENHYAGGGGGAGYNGGTGIYQTNIAGEGGIGIDLKSVFGTGVGASGLFGGGGGGMTSGVGTGGSGGLGGGGSGGTGASSTGVSGSDSTGGGGGGGSSKGGSGGSGVVVIRYRQKNREGNSEIQFIKGASIVSGNTNYKIGNYGGDFKVKSSTFNSDTDRVVVQSGGDIRFNNTGGMAVATIFNNGDFRTAGSQISDSDNRIKKDVEAIDEAGALRMIMAVEPKTYTYIDGRKDVNGSCESSGHREHRVYGFIAQQIREVIPDATETTRDIVPNIMKRAVRDKNRVYLDLTGYADLPVNEERKINIRFKNGGGYNFAIVEVNKEYFVIDTEDKGVGEVFVYGYEVNDFHILTKESIYTLNVSATQELCRKIESQERRIKELEEKLSRVDC